MLAPADYADQPVWIDYSRRRAFPISAVISAGLHVLGLVLALLGILSLFGDKGENTIEFETVYIQESPGGGSNGQEIASGVGIPQGVDNARSIEPKPWNQPNLADLKLPTVQHAAPEPLLKPNEVDDRDPFARRVGSLPKIESLKPLLKGRPDGVLTKNGVGRGNGRGAGSGNGVGNGDGTPGNLSVKQKRQLRWTLLFNIRSANDYLDQLSRLKAIIGIQYGDHSIKLITNLMQRPAKLEPGDRVPDRIFWMDDNPEAVNSTATELGLNPKPWRIIAFFPANIEEELLRKERAYGKRFGRQTEDDIRETIFRVEDRFGNIVISVESQEGK